MILVGSDYWNPMWEWVKGTLLERGYISSEDLDLVSIMDDPDEVVRTIKRTVII
jgi:predicted Rossmann-fold nucleotide-binding protein